MVAVFLRTPRKTESGARVLGLLVNREADSFALLTVLQTQELTGLQVLERVSGAYGVNNVTMPAALEHVTGARSEAAWRRLIPGVLK
jgi:hypothetical protein